MKLGFDWITSRVGLGGKIEDVEDVRTLVSSGVTHILNVATECDDAPFIKQAGATLGYAKIATEDDGGSKGTAWFQQCLEFLDAALKTPQNRVYVHCVAGFNRSASIVYTLLRAFGLSGFEAHLLIDRHRVIDVAGTRYAGDADRALRELGFPL